MLNPGLTERAGGLRIDLNCDMGEGMNDDGKIMPFISSVNIACGGHAGDEDSMRRTIELALEHHVAIGAHPSYEDRANFGRIDLLEGIPAEKAPDVLHRLPDQLAGQLSRLQFLCDRHGTRLRHVKPHGALYNRAARDPVVAAIICRVVHSLDPGLLVFGLSGSLMGAVAARAGLRYVHEVFADRTYRDDGSLTPRTEPGALIEDGDQAIAQVLRMVTEGTVSTISGVVIAIPAQSVCLHGDGRHAAAVARRIREELDLHGISIKPPGAAPL